MTDKLASSPAVTYDDYVKLRDALAFYANPANWTAQPGPDTEFGPGEPVLAAAVDGGTVARAALEATPATSENKTALPGSLALVAKPRTKPVDKPVQRIATVLVPPTHRLVPLVPSDSALAAGQKARQEGGSLLDAFEAIVLASASPSSALDTVTDEDAVFLKAYCERQMAHARSAARKQEVRLLLATVTRLLASRAGAARYARLKAFAQEELMGTAGKLETEAGVFQSFDEAFDATFPAPGVAVVPPPDGR